ncbi:nitrilase-related carbon-nitrogen hydrolase [Kribbella swartbergensis]
MDVRVAACQTAADVDRPDSAVVVAAVRRAAAAGARLVVLPEQAVSGCCFHDADEARAAAEPPDGPTVQLLRSLSAEHDCVLVGGYCELGESGQIYNSAVVVDGGEVLHNYRKVHLWGREATWFTPGSQPPAAVDTRAGRIAAMICYDLEFPEFVRLAALDGADIVAAPCNWPLLPRPVTERPLELIKAQASAGTNKVHIVVADRCGAERGTEWIGGSAIIDASGYLLAGAGTPYGATAEEIVLTADLDLASARDKRLGPHNDAFADRRPALYAGLA